MWYEIYQGDVLEVMENLENNSFDAVLCDPPYGLSEEPNIETVLSKWLNEEDYQHRGGGFMGKSWDSFVPGPSVWKQLNRLVKPGAFMLSFAGTRTQDLMGISLRMGGFQFKDCLMYLYGSGFPKGQDIGKMVDKKQGAEREVTGQRLSAYGDPDKSETNDGRNLWNKKAETNIVELKNGDPVTEQGEQWDGYNITLKPAYEPIILAKKKPDKTNVNNVLKWETGALNIDECRISINSEIDDSRLGGKGTWKTEGMAKQVYEGGYSGETVTSSEKGRFPANVIHDGSEEATKEFPNTSSPSGKVNRKPRQDNKVFSNKNCGFKSENLTESGFGDNGSASRYFYCAKPRKNERNAGLDKGETNNHPTIKPISLNKYLATLLLPPERETPRRILVPFCGSGSEIIGCLLAGWDEVIGIELDQKYVDIAHKRISYWTNVEQDNKETEQSNDNNDIVSVLFK